MKRVRILIVDMSTLNKLSHNCDVSFVKKRTGIGCDSTQEMEG